MGRFSRSGMYQDEFESWYEYTEPNALGEHLTVCVVDVYPDNEKDTSLPRIMHDLGMIEEMPDSYLHVDTFVQRGGVWYAGYNPTKRIRMDGTFEWDPAWLLEAGDENEAKVLREVERRFMEA